jgi:hypothetical protein
MSFSLVSEFSIEMSFLRRFVPLHPQDSFSAGHEASSSDNSFEAEEETTTTFKRIKTAN